MSRVNITGFATNLITVSEDVGDGVWRLTDENGDEFVLSNGEVRDLYTILDAVIDELNNRED